MFKRAADFRLEARNALRGKWGISLLVSLVAGLLGAQSSNSSINFSSNTDTSIFSEGFWQSSFGNFPVMNNSAYLILSIISISIVIALVIVIVLSMLGSGVELGQNSFYISLVRGEGVNFEMLFSRFKILFKAWGLRLYMTLFTLLWMLLFIVPGIIAAYRYSMAPYIMAQNPDIGIMEAVNRSKQIMRGNKGRLFCLGFSFIGWSLLCVLTFGIGYLWLNPYVAAANAAFYLDVTGQSPFRPEVYSEY